MEITALLKNKEEFWKFFRFCVVGVIAAGIHYAVYYWLQHYINVNIAYTLGYCFSLVCNFFMTSYLTFKSSPSFKKAAGFGVSHLINYFNHMILLNVFLYLGFSKVIAPFLVLAIAVPINFLLLRWVFKNKKANK